jgi:hypothetical protein
MPEKTLVTRAKQAKKKGTTLRRKASDVGAAYGESPHHAKKSSRALGDVGFADRHVSPRSPPGKGLTARSKKLPVPEGGRSSASRRKTLPSVAAAAYRKDGTAKRTTGRGDASPLKAGKAYSRKPARTRSSKSR